MAAPTSLSTQLEGRRRTPASFLLPCYQVQSDQLPPCVVSGPLAHVCSLPGGERQVGAGWVIFPR